MTMNKKSLFKASFEESLNLEDDGFVQFQKRDVYGKSEKYIKNGETSFGFRFLYVILTFLFPVGLNFLLVLFSTSLHNTNHNLPFPISNSPLLIMEIYWTCLSIWFLLVFLGKLLKSAYLIPYRTHFHVVTFSIWLTLEIDLLVIDLATPSLSIWGMIAIFLIMILSAYLMFTNELKTLQTLIYREKALPRLRDKIASKLTIYGAGILIIGLMIKYILSAFSVSFSTSIQAIGLFLAWIVLNIGLLAMLVFMEFPTFLQAYYKWKYPEGYRQWEGKSLEEWYGKNYLKKHKELLKNEEKITI